MNSPVIPYKSFITLNRGSQLPLFIQMSNQLINAIQRGLLPEGTKLPGTRIMSQLFNVHRNTIVAVYQELENQSWIEVHPNKGSYVLKKAENNRIKLGLHTASQPHSIASYPKQTAFEFEQSNIFDSPFQHSALHDHLDDGTPDPRLTAIELPSKLYATNVRRSSNRKKFDINFTYENDYLKKHLANYLNQTRGLHIGHQNILITRSIEMSIYLCSKIILQPQEKVVVASLSYFKTNMTFQNFGAQILTVPIDEHGLDTDSLRGICERNTVRIVYITPHYHYPTTVTLSAQRRIELLELAREFNFIVLEDDDDFDFQYDNHPILPLCSADVDGRVIYTGNLGKFLAPGFRIGFIVAPENFIIEARRQLDLLDRQGDLIMESVIGELIEEGEIHRYFKKNNKIYKERRDYFTSELTKQLGNRVHFKTPSGGLALWVQWKESVNLMQLKKKAAQNDLFIPQNCLYQNPQLTAMRIGFGHYTAEEADRIMAKLQLSLDMIN